ELAQGIESAQNKLQESTALINPSLIADEQYVDEKRGRRVVRDVKFKVGVNVHSIKGKKGGIGVATGVFTLGGAGNTENISESAHTIEFTVPVSMPVKDELKSRGIKVQSNVF